MLNLALIILVAVVEEVDLDQDKGEMDHLAAKVLW